ncbi:hypothetical protein ScPMuIL_017918 [Solemya velum]
MILIALAILLRVVPGYDGQYTFPPQPTEPPQPTDPPQPTEPPQPAPTPPPVPDCSSLGPKWISPPYPSYSCYKFSGKEKDWFKANTRCSSQKPGMNCSLVRIETDVEDDWLSGKMSNSKGNRWIWLRGNVDNDWQWEDSPNEFIRYDGENEAHYDNFSYGEPNNHESRGEYCGSKVRRDDGRWQDFPCSNTQKFICECRPHVLVNVNQPDVGYGVDVVDVANHITVNCIYGQHYYIENGQLVVYDSNCLGEYALYYL